MDKMKAYIQDRIGKLRPQLATARDMYAKTVDTGWACRMNELTGRLSELEVLLHKIERDEQR